jgi:tetratricopeptide (TPR) repeat protein
VGENDAPGGLPRSIQVLLTARLEALPEPELDVVRVAAVAGREFSVSAVGTLVGRPIEVELDRLEQRELIEPSVAGRCQFGHALLQEAAYGLIPKGRRGDLHVQLARWLDADGASDAVVGDHLERAFLLRSELGQVDEATARLGEEAGARLAAAGRWADAMGDPQRARRLLERALDLLPVDSPQQAAAMVELAAAAWNLLPRAEAERLLTTGADLAAGHGLRALELRARLLRLGTISDDSPEALTEHEVIAQTNAALEELEMLDAPRAIASALCTRANAEYALGRAADAFASADRALQVLRAADEDTVWALENLVQSVLDSPMPVPAAEELLGRLVHELGVRPTVRSELIRGQAELALMGGRPDEAWTLLDTVQEIDRDLGRNLARWLSQRRGVMLVRAGRFEEARSMLTVVVAEMDEGGDSSDYARRWLGLAEVRLGSVVGTAIPPAAGYEAGTQAHLLTSEVHLAGGDVERALAHAREAVKIAATGDWVVLEGDARLTLARALDAAGDQAAAAVQARAAVELQTGKGNVPGVAAAEALLESLVLTRR